MTNGNSSQNKITLRVIRLGRLKIMNIRIKVCIITSAKLKKDMIGEECEFYW
jgi:predicted aspartyl protease